MTNILKDVWEDWQRGACWLPQDVFGRHGVELGGLHPQRQAKGFDASMRELVGVAHAHLRNALAFTLLIPKQEAGIRRFCLWAIGLAVLTLRRIEASPGFTAGNQVKISRSAVGVTTVLSNAAVGNDWLLRRLFAVAAIGLPLAAPAAIELPQRPLESAVTPRARAHDADYEEPRDLRRCEGSSGR
jgi:farnesyl-diphosphate farnesyltransferase